MGAALDFVREVGNLPAMPEVATRVLNFDEADSRNGAELARVVGGDPALSARLIKVSNSAYYSFARRLGTVREAILVIGFRQVRQIVLGAALMDTWKRLMPCEGFTTELFWEHSLVVAMAAETAARLDGRIRPEEAFTAGLLHDIGILAMLVGDRDRMIAALRSVRAGTLVVDAEREAYGFDHAGAGEALAELWAFPQVLIQAIGGHHDARVGQGDGLPGLVAVAARLSLAQGVAAGYRTAPQESLDPELDDLARACGGFDSLLGRARAFVDSVTGIPRRDRSAA